MYGKDFTGKKEVSNYLVKRFNELGYEVIQDETYNVIAEKRVNVLMGDIVEPRKEWIEENVDFTLEDNYV